MKKTRQLLTGIFLGLILSSILYFLFFPLSINASSFIFGFLSCVIVILILISLLPFFNKNANVSPIEAKYLYKTRKAFYFPLLIIIVSLTCLFLINKYQKSTEEQAQYYNSKMVLEQARTAAAQRGNTVHLMSNLLQKVEAELNNSKERTLSDNTIRSIADLANSFKPYQAVVGDSLSDQKLSPERGYLILALSKMRIDSHSYSKLKLMTSFAYADLRDKDLRNLDMSGLDLEKADLSNADLRGTNLKHTNLKFSLIWGAKMDNAILDNAYLTRANLAWAELNNASILNANLKGINLSNAKLRHAKLDGSSIRWAELSGVFLNDASCISVDLYGSVLTKGQLKRVNFQNANLLFANFSDTNIEEANFTGSILIKLGVAQADWLERLDAWKVEGVAYVRENYTIITEPTSRSNFTIMEK